MIDRIARSIKASFENPSTSLADPDSWLLDALGGGETNAGVRVNQRTAIGFPPFLRGVSLISGAVAKLPMLVYEQVREEKRRAKDHSAYRTLRRKANSAMTAFQFKRLLTYHALMRGNGYAAIFRPLTRGDRLELIPLNPGPAVTYPIQTEAGIVYRTKIGNEEKFIPARDVLHIKGLSFDGLVGHDVISVAANSLGLGMAAQEFGARFFKEGSNASGVLMVPGHFDQKTINNTIEKWSKMSAGLQRSHKVALLQDGVKWQQISISNEQAQFLQTRKFELLTVALVLGLPPHKLGDDSRISYNSLEQENLAYLDDSIDPWLHTWESECEDKLLTEQEEESHFIEFVREALISVEIQTKIEALIKQVNNTLLSPDEARAVTNRGPIPGGHGKRFRVPVNIGYLDAEEPEEPDDVADDDQVDQPSDQVRQAFRNLLFDRGERMLRIERTKVSEAAARGGNFVAWLDEWYPGFQLKFEDSLKLPLEAAQAALGSDPADLQAFAAAYCQASRERLLQAAGEVGQQDLAAAVGQLTATWSQRIEDLVEQLLGAELNPPPAA